MFQHLSAIHQPLLWYHIEMKKAQEKKKVIKTGGKKQVVIVINGSGGVGKHSLIDFASNYYEIRDTSSIVPIKKLAMDIGWEGEYDEKGRRLLVDIKQALIRYNDLPTKYVVGEYKKFKAVEQDVMFVHIREPEEIAKFRAIVPCKTVLIVRDGAPKWNIDTEERTGEFQYDYIFDNSQPLEKTGPKFVKLIDKIRNSKADLPLLENID